MSFTAPSRTLRRHHRPGQVAVLTAALTLTLTACNGGSEPAETSAPASATPTETASASRTASGSPTMDTSTPPTANAGSSSTSTTAASGEYVPASADGPAQNVPKPEMPAAMKEETKEGAEAAVRHFWEAIYYTDQTGESSDFDSTYSEYCELCKAVSDSTIKHYKDGGWSTGERTSIKSMTLTPSEFGFTATFTRDASAVSVFNSKGVKEDSASGPETHNEAWVADLVYEPSAKHWVIDEMQKQEGVR